MDDKRTIGQHLDDTLKELVTKDDLRQFGGELRGEMKVMETGIRADMKAMETGIRADM